jgi:beta-xylosidase
LDRSANNYAFVGINLYSSPDLKNWTFVNQILKKTSHPDLNNDAVVERAKILHNKKTGQFVMWMHFEGHNAYKIAEVGLATCNTIGGNYTFHSHFRPLDIDSRDINVYQDDDGKGYLICTTKGNQNVSLFELDSTYTKVVREIYRGSASDDMECEGHAIIKQAAIISG